MNGISFDTSSVKNTIFSFFFIYACVYFVNEFSFIISTSSINSEGDKS